MIFKEFLTSLAVALLLFVIFTLVTRSRIRRAGFVWPFLFVLIHLGRRRLDPAIWPGAGAYSLAAVLGGRIACRASGRVVCTPENAPESPRDSGAAGGVTAAKAA